MPMNVFKMRDGDGSRSQTWYGKIKLAPKRWKRVKLFTDKLSSERRLRELQCENDQRVTGVQTSMTDHALRPMADHVDEYLASLKLHVSSADHHAIASSMLKRLVTACKWNFIRDMSIPSVEQVLPDLAKTESYRNGFIKRVKAFAQWLEDQGRVTVHPLRKLKRVSEKNATRTRARRAATREDSAALFALKKLPDDRRLSYALAALNGLRRNEISKLTWDRLHLTAAIPFIDVAQKNGTTGELDSIPLHPYVVKLLGQRTAGMPGVRVVRAVPDVATLEKDLTHADVSFVDAATKRRLDFHGLRHTFQTDLDRAGCSRATKKRLMRHAASDVTDGYAHVELAEMLAALCRLPSPDEPSEIIATATGTDDAKVSSHKGPPAGPPLDHRLSRFGTPGGMKLQPATAIPTRQDRAIGTQWHSMASVGLPLSGSGDTVEISRPDTQVD